MQVVNSADRVPSNIAAPNFDGQYIQVTTLTVAFEKQMQKKSMEPS